MTLTFILILPLWSSTEMFRSLLTWAGADVTSQCTGERIVMAQKPWPGVHQMVLIESRTEWVCNSFGSLAVLKKSEEVQKCWKAEATEEETTTWLLPMSSSLWFLGKVKLVWEEAKPWTPSMWAKPFDVAGSTWKRNVLQDLPLLEGAQTRGRQNSKYWRPLTLSKCKYTV